MGQAVASEHLSDVHVRAKVAEALAEDLGDPPRDPTTESIVPEDLHAEALLLARSEGVLAGMFVAAEGFRQLDTPIEVKPLIGGGGGGTGGRNPAPNRGAPCGVALGWGGGVTSR